MIETKKAAEPEQKQVSEEKKQIVEEITEKIKQYPIVGVVNLEGLPGRQLMQMKRQLRGQIELYMTRKKLIQRAVQESAKQKKGIDKLLPEIKGIPALIFTKTNPFLLYKTIKKSKSPAAAKPGQLSPKDLVVPAGPTPFTPGPIIAELGSFGIKTMVENGKLVVRADTVVVKEGQVINDKLAGLLSKFGIEPMEVGLNVTTMFEDGIVYPKSVLDVDEKEFMQQLCTTAHETYNVAFEIGYTTKETIEPLIAKVGREARTLALEAKILADEVMEEILAQAEREMNALKGELKLPDAPKEPVAAEPNQTSTTTTEDAKEVKVEVHAKQSLSGPLGTSSFGVKKEEHKVKTEVKKEQPKQEPVEKKVDKIVQEVKQAQNRTSAEDLLKEAEKIKEDEKPVQQTNPDQAKKVQDKQSLSGPQGTRSLGEKEKKEMENIEKLTQKLMKKGTLR